MAVVRLSAVVQQSAITRKIRCRKRTSLCPVACRSSARSFTPATETVGPLGRGWRLNWETSLREDDEHITLTGVQGVGKPALPENDADARPPDI